MSQRLSFKEGRSPVMKALPAALTALAFALAAVPADAHVTSTGSIGSDKGAFQAACAFSHQLPDDPIVFFGTPGASHAHDFYGAATTNAFSTPATLRSSETSCLRTDAQAGDTDRSGYWVPLLYVDGREVRATALNAYYTTGVRRRRSIEPFPAGLKILVGSAAGGPQEVDAERVWAYLCPAGTVSTGSPTTAPTCATNRMDLNLRFPDCWNGRDLDSPDHKSHMAYSRRAKGAKALTCPATHPRMMPRLQLTLRYPTPGGPGVRLGTATGAVNTAHADFMNGWTPGSQETLVRGCLVADRYCGGGDPPANLRRASRRKASSTKSTRTPKRSRGSSGRGSSASRASRIHRH